MPPSPTPPPRRPGPPPPPNHPSGEPDCGLVRVFLTEDHAVRTGTDRWDAVQRKARRHDRAARHLLLDDDDEDEDWGPIDPHAFVDGWQLDGALGSGAQANVFRAVRDGRAVAFRWLAPVRSRPMTRARAENEIKVLKLLLGVDGVIQMIAHGVSAGRPYVVFELAQGDLNMLGPGPLHPIHTAVIFAQICHGLAAAHARGIVHRDIKPGNILVMRKWLVKIGDWGIVRAPRPIAEVTLTLPGEVIGTIAYMAPEFFADDPSLIGPHSDIYSTGTMLAQLSSGLPPIVGPDGQVKIPRVLGGLGEIVTRATASDPRRRPTALEMAAALEEFTLRGS